MFVPIFYYANFFGPIGEIKIIDYQTFNSKLIPKNNDVIFYIAFRVSEDINIDQESYKNRKLMQNLERSLKCVSIKILENPIYFAECKRDCAIK
jgi:hypothetical protein